MKILVILTGGTISSSEKNGVISPNVSPLESLAGFYRNRHGFDIAFNSLSPYTILSENLSGKHLNALVKCVNDSVCRGYNKIIVCHGTDTLQYSSAALSYALAGKDCCPVLVSAGKPLHSELSNGFENFCAAVEFLKNADMRGVFAAYKNTDDHAKILPADGLTLHREADDALYDIDGRCAAEYDGEKLVLNDRFSVKQTGGLPFELFFSDRSDIHTVCAVPGGSYAFCPENTKAVILRPYHSGTLDTKNPDFRAFCVDAKGRNLPVFAVNSLPGAQYESSCAFEELGVIPLEEYAFAAAYIKLWLAPEREMALKEFMLQG